MYPYLNGYAQAAGYTAFKRGMSSAPPVDFAALESGANELRAKLWALFARMWEILGRKGYLAVIALTIFFLAFSLYRLDYSKYSIFDEQIYISNGEALAHLQIPTTMYADPHPPLGKIILGIGIVLLGDNPVGWRLLEVIFATLLIPILYLLSRRVFRTGRLAVLPAFLLTFDFMHFVLGRMALLETFLVFFSLLMQYGFYAYFQFAINNSYGHSTKWMILTAVGFGLAVATKWPAIFSLLGFGIVFLYITLRRLQTSRKNHEKWIRITLIPIILTGLGLVLSSIIYLASYLPYFVSGWSLNLVLWLQTNMYKFHTNLSSTSRTFIYTSGWWSWPLMLTPIPLIHSANSTSIQLLLMIGNPAIWWTTYPIIGLSVYQTFKKRDKKLTYIFLAFLSSWLPFAALTRFEIIYYYYVSLPLLTLLITYWIQMAWQTRIGKILAAGYLLTVVFLFIQFFPIISAQTIPNSQSDGLRWLPSWGA